MSLPSEERLHEISALVAETLRIQRKGKGHGWSARAQRQVLDSELSPSDIGALVDAALRLRRLEAALARVGRALSDEVGGDHEALHEPGCPCDDTCSCLAARLVNESIAAEVGDGCADGDDETDLDDWCPTDLVGDETGGAS